MFFFLDKKEPKIIRVTLFSNGTHEGFAIQGCNA